MTPLNKPICTCKVNTGEPCIDSQDCQQRFVKNDAGKIDWTLVPFDGIVGIIPVREMGVRKYGHRDNWRLCDDPSRYLKAAFRHMIAHESGELLDAESGLPHLDHALCSLAFYQALVRNP